MSTRRTPDGDGDAGFSLIEVVITAALLLVVTIPIFRFFNSSMNQVTRVQGMIEEQARARLAITDLENDLRNSFTGQASLGRVETISPTGITFYAADRGTPMALHKISYRLSGGTLQRWMLTSSNTVSTGTYTWTFPTTTVPMSWIPLVGGVTNTTVFVYKDANNVVLDPAIPANVDNVRVVQATVQVRSPSAKASQQPDTYTITVQLRGEG